MVKTYTIESMDYRARMSEHEDGHWVTKPDYDALAAELAATQRRAEAAEADMTKLASDLAAEQESNTFLNNLHGMDVARVETLEVVLRRVQTALDQTSPVLWKALKAAVNEVLTPTGTPTNPTMQHAPDCPILHGKECLCDPFPLETGTEHG